MENGVETDKTQNPGSTYIYRKEACDFIYKSAVKSKIYPNVDYNYEKMITIDTDHGVVSYLDKFIAICPGNEEKARLLLLKSVNEIKASDELRKLLLTVNQLDQVTESVKTRIDNILLVHYIPGRCDACRRLGL